MYVCVCVYIYIYLYRCYYSFILIGNHTQRIAHSRQITSALSCVFSPYISFSPLSVYPSVCFTHLSLT